MFIVFAWRSLLKFLLIGFSGLYLVCAALVGLYFDFPLIPPSKKICIFIRHQENFHTVLLDLTQQVPFFSSVLFRFYARQMQVDRHLEAGEYCFIARDSMHNILSTLRDKKRQRHAFTLLPGWTYHQLCQSLQHAVGLDQAVMLEKNAVIARALGLAVNRLEGAFYPDTYYYAYPDTPLEILKAAHVSMLKKLNQWYVATQTTASPPFFEKPYDLLIAASIIEKEAGVVAEQRRVAGVLVNRLQKHMKLQMDPTVTYGLESADSGRSQHQALTKQDLNTKTPYNTYLYFGLPPTPICMPSASALAAAAFPEKTTFLYYVSTVAGSLHFSEDLRAHHLAVQHYRQHQED